jgi:hypothetical protein
MSLIVGAFLLPIKLMTFSSSNCLKASLSSNSEKENEFPPRFSTLFLTSSDNEEYLTPFLATSE